VQTLHYRIQGKKNQLCDMKSSNYIGLFFEDQRKYNKDMKFL
jgi:hypothetical protein